MQASAQSLEPITGEKNQVLNAVLWPSDRRHGVCTRTLIHARHVYNYARGTESCLGFSNSHTLLGGLLSEEGSHLMQGERQGPCAFCFCCNGAQPPALQEPLLEHSSEASFQSHSAQGILMSLSQHQKERDKSTGELSNMSHKRFSTVNPRVQIQSSLMLK